MNNKKKSLLIIFLVSFASLTAWSQNTNENYNILWLSCEDIDPIIACYGAEGIQTPNIDRLAKEGIL
ncbi:MAG: sulfatase, partial [Bacteroidales bacterium]